MSTPDFTSAGPSGYSMNPSTLNKDVKFESPSPGNSFNQPQKPRGMDTSGFKPEDQGAQLVPVPDFLSNFVKATWKISDAYDRVQQTQIKEAAVHAGIRFLDSLEARLRLVAPDIKSAGDWAERIASIKLSKQNDQVFIGLRGTTGVGKSSLVNSLLDETHLLPADNTRACTAVCVEISWNTSTDPDAAYRATVHRVTAPEWELELQNLLKDIKDQADNKDGDDGEYDLDRDERIKSALHKVQCVYPFIKTQKDVMKYTIEALVTHDNVKNLLGQTTTVSFSTAKAFANAIKTYINSDVSTEEGCAQWPLITVVQLYLKARILMDGIVLVDLPGSMDTNAARGSIAEKYQQKLSVTCVLAEAHRASSNKPAQDILGKVTQLRLQFDGQFSSKHLCFIVTKIDTHMEVDRYIEDHPNLAAHLSPLSNRLKQFEENLDAVRVWCKRTRIRTVELENDISSLDHDIKKLSKKIKNLGNCNAEDPGTSKKRKRSTADVSHSKEGTLLLNNKLAELNVKRKEADYEVKNLSCKLQHAQPFKKKLSDTINSLHSQKTLKSIQNRNSVTATALRRDYEDLVRQTGQNPGDSQPLKIFSVSSKAFSNFLVKGKTELCPGFRKPADTGVPALQEWLVQSTLPTRDRNATAFLEKIISLELSMRGWINDDQLDTKLEPGQRLDIERAFDIEYQELSRRLQDSNLDATTRVQKLITTNLFTRMPVTERIATEGAEQIVRSWAQSPMAWSTHRAINKNQGTWTSYNRVHYDFNADLCVPYLEALLPKWTDTFFVKKLPDIRKQYEVDTKKAVLQFSDGLFDEAMKTCPEMEKALDLWKQSAIRSWLELETTSNFIFKNAITETAKEAHPEIKAKITAAWLPIYQKCGEEKGKGHFKRNIATHVLHIKGEGGKMYKRCTRAVKVKLQALGETLPAKFDNGTEAVLAGIKSEFQAMIERHTPAGDRMALERAERKAKEQVRTDFAQLCEELQAEWAFVPQKVEIVVEEDEPVNEDVLVNIDDLDKDLKSATDSEDDSSDDSDESDESFL